MSILRKLKIEPAYLLLILVMGCSMIGLFAFILDYLNLLRYPKVHEAAYDTQADHVEKIELIEGFDTENIEHYIIKFTISAEMTQTVLQSLDDMKYYAHFTGPWYPSGACFLIHYTDGAFSFICRNGVARYDHDSQEIEVSYAPLRAEESVFNSVWNEFIKP